ncbi:MAG: serine hydrolase, partial [Polyangiaceae bacterium]
MPIHILQTASVTRDLRANEVAERIVRDGVAPTCAAGFATLGRGIFVGGATGTFFDLASITKSMTAVAVASSSLDRTAKLADVLPELAATPSASASIEILLAHRAGLEAHVQMWLRENMQPAQMLLEAA